MFQQNRNDGDADDDDDDEDELWRWHTSSERKTVHDDEWKQWKRWMPNGEVLVNAVVNVWHK